MAEFSAPERPGSPSVNIDEYSRTKLIEAATAWSGFRKTAFRFLFLYWWLYCLQYVLQYIPFVEKIPFNAAARLIEGHQKLWFDFVPWVGANVLKLATPITVFPNGSGDTTFNYVQVLCYVVLALAGTVVWSLFDWRSSHYTRMNDVLRTMLRYVLALTMLGYGMHKVIQLQFPFPGPERLLEPYGDSSPMGLLWAFMGYSKAYNVFAGAGEVIGGVLLFFRRTTTLGALILIGVLSNVVMLNFCYDVPVKLYSSHLLIMAVYLTLPDLRRLLDVLVFNRPTPARNIAPVFSRSWLYYPTMIAKLAFLGWVGYLHTTSALEMRKMYGDLAPPSPLAGIYDVEEFSRNGEVQPLLTTNKGQWRRLVVDRYVSSIRFIDDEHVRYQSQVNPALSVITLTPRGTATGSTLTYSQPDPEHLTVNGLFAGDQILVRMKKVDAKSFLLVGRGFNWIQEYPFNR